MAANIGKDEDGAEQREVTSEVKVGLAVLRGLQIHQFESCAQRRKKRIAKSNRKESGGSLSWTPIRLRDERLGLLLQRTTP